jgi:hypothetical protein
VLKLFYVVSLCVCVCVCVMSFRWSPPCWMHRCTRVEKLRISRSVSSEMFTIWSRISCLSALKSSGHLLYTLLFK